MKALTLFSFCAVLFLTMTAPVSAVTCTTTVPSGGDIQAAINNASPGDVICLVNGGTYTAAVRININKSVTLTAVDPLTPPLPVISGSGSPPPQNVLFVAANNVTLDGLEVAHGTADLIRQDGPFSGTTVRNCVIHDSHNSGDEAIELVKCTNCLIDSCLAFDIAQDGFCLSESSNSSIHNCEVHHSNSENSAIYVYYSEDITVSCNYVHDSTASNGIKIYKMGTSGTNIVENNLIVKNTFNGTKYPQDGNAIQLYVPFDEVNVDAELYVRHNTAADNTGTGQGGSLAGHGVYWGQKYVNGSPVYILDNILAGNSGWGIKTELLGSVTPTGIIDYNDTWDNGLGTISNAFPNVVVGSHNISADPLFNSDYTLQPSSPAVGAASDGKDMGLLWDGTCPRFLPRIECLNPVVGTDPGDCFATVTCAQIATCDGTLTCEPPAPYELGPTPVAVTCTREGSTYEADCTVTVEDREAPVLSGVPPDETMECDNVPAPADVTATDNCDNNIDVAFHESRANGPCPDSYTLTRTWTATDSAGNTATETQVITVQDTLAPVLSGVPPDATVECSNVPPPPEVTATDNCDQNVQITYAQARTNGTCDDSYTLTRTWTAVDNCSNTAIGTQVITVRDTTPPVLSGVPEDITVECDVVPDPAAVGATDNCDTAVEIVFNEVRTDGPCPDSYVLTRTWTATDNCGKSTAGTQVITVQDTTTPVLSGVPEDVTVECDVVPDPAAVGATDNCDMAVQIEYSQARTDGPCEDSYTLTRIWSAMDDCGNKAIGTQVITVQDTTPPVLLGIPADITVACDGVPPPASPSATDNCDPSPTITYNQLRTNGPTKESYTLTRTWTATDNCNNQDVETQVITVRFCPFDCYDVNEMKIKYLKGTHQMTEVEVMNGQLKTDLPAKTDRVILDVEGYTMVNVPFSAFRLDGDWVYTTPKGVKPKIELRFKPGHCEWTFHIWDINDFRALFNLADGISVDLYIGDKVGHFNTKTNYVVTKDTITFKRPDRERVHCCP